MPVLLVGCGHMGRAMARGWAGRDTVFVYDPFTASVPGGAERIDTLDRFDKDSLTIVLAVKPQVFGALAPSLRRLAEGEALVVSIMAGITLGDLSDALGGAKRIVRAMPNTPAAIGRGITAAAAGSAITGADRVRVAELFASTGALLWLDDEAQMDAVTAVSGSGPAYFFRFAEALAHAGAKAGLAPEIAMRLARSSFTGAAALAEMDAVDLADLRRQVTSPGGTTSAGLEQMDNCDAIDRLAEAIVTAAAARSRELGG